MQDYCGTHTIIFSILNNKQFNPVNLLKSAWQTSMPDAILGFDGKYLLFVRFFSTNLYHCMNCSFHDNMLICFVQICRYTEKSVWMLMLIAVIVFLIGPGSM